MAWEKLLSAKRVGQDSADGPVDRSAFHRDCDRLTFSSSFRRLSRKTQVHPMSENDHVHNRLTHSLEVASVGRSLGYAVGQRLKTMGVLPADREPTDVAAIVQAACLAHDIGNPPFGHLGEEVVRQWFAHPAHLEYTATLHKDALLDFSLFEGNAQGFRVVTQLENHRNAGGLRLTYAVLGSAIKYPYSASVGQEKRKFGFYQSESSIFVEVATGLDLRHRGHNVWSRHPLSYLMEAADDICYAILDLEDAVEINCLTYEEVSHILLWGLPEHQHESVKKVLAAAPSDRSRMQHLRGLVMDAAVEATVELFFDNYNSIMSGTYQGALLDNSHSLAAKMIHRAKDVAKARIYVAPDARMMRAMAFPVLNRLLDIWIPLYYRVHGNAKGWANCELSDSDHRLLKSFEFDFPDAKDTLYGGYQKILDHLAGMTDNYACQAVAQITGRQPWL